MAPVAPKGDRFGPLLHLMSLQGNLATLDLTSLFQSLESARKTGLLTVRDELEETQLFFAEGRLALITESRRPGLIDFLVEAGVLATEALDRAKKHKRRGQSIGAALVDAEAISAAQLSEVAKARLTDDACEILARGASTFEFAECEKPPTNFDAEEHALAMGLDICPLLLESARRSDHWSMIREHLPSDSVHYRVAKPPREPADRAQARFLAQVVKLLDGSRSVRDVVAQFPTRRFAIYQLLADLAKSQTIRAVAVAELNEQVLELARRDRKRARALLERGLEKSPHHLALLRTKAQLAEKMGEKHEAGEALKEVAHLELEGSDREAARGTLLRIKALEPSDPFGWEKSFEMALEDGRGDDAAADAKALNEIYRKLGLHQKTVGVLERLSALVGTKWEVVRDLSRAHAAAGEVDAGVKCLERYAASLIELESYPAACKAYEEVLAIQPSSAKAKETLQHVKSGALAKRKARMRKLRRRLFAYFLGFVVLPWLLSEALARHAYVEATRSLVRGRFLESGRLAEARSVYDAVRAKYPWTLTALFEIDPVLAELDLRIAESSDPGLYDPGPR